MKAGTENRNKTIAAGVLGMCALLGVIYMLYTFLGGGPPPTPPPSIAPVTKTINSTNAALSEPANAPSSSSASSVNVEGRPAVMPTGNAAGVGAKKIASSSASLDPTLDQTAMLRTESLVYSGSGRNIFSLVYVPPPPTIEQAKFSARPKGPVVPAYVAPAAPPTCPPSCPPINLKFFGTETHGNGVRSAFLLQGDDVFLAGQGDIVARRYKIVSISATSIQVEDMGNNNTQTLPLQN